MKPGQGSLAASGSAWRVPCIFSARIGWVAASELSALLLICGLSHHDRRYGVAESASGEVAITMSASA
jgi:hypothetical protein